MRLKKHHKVSWFIHLHAISAYRQELKAGFAGARSPPPAPPSSSSTQQLFQPWIKAHQQSYQKQQHWHIDTGVQKAIV